MDENSSPYSDAYLISTTMSLPASSLSICGMQPAAAKSETEKNGASSPTFITLSCGGHAVLKQFIPRMPTSALNCGQMLVPRPEYVRPPTVTSMSLMMAGRRRCVLASRHASALLLARYRVQLTGGLVSLALVLILARIRSGMAHDGHQWPANIEFGDFSHTWPRWHSHVSLLRMFLYWVSVAQQKGAASDPF